MAAIAQTIAIVDKSGKVVSTSKQLKNVFKEAKFAYQERKAEIKADRQEREDRELRKAIKAMSVADEERSNISRSHSRPGEDRHRSHSQRDRERDHERRVRPSAGDRNYSSGSVRSGHASPGSPASRHSSPRSPLSRRVSGHTDREQDYYYSGPRDADLNREPGSTELMRRRTDLDLAAAPNRPPRPLSRTHTSPVLDTNVDMDLAYGEFHPDSISPHSVSPVSPRGLALTKSVQQKEELSSLVLKCKMLLDEANCAQHSAKAVMAHLQKNPDAMAAVALTLAEISNVASKMAPGALAVLKATAPTIFGLLAAPEFLIAVGVSVGITVVMFGGYKIIKKIQAARAGDSGSDALQRKGSAGVDEMIDVEELSHIEQWRRGIADDAFDDTSSMAGSVATSVEGEFISPFAERSMGHLPLQKTRSKEDKKEKKERKERESREKKERKKSRKGSAGGRSDVGSERSSVSRTSTSMSEKDKAGRALIKVKKPSPLRRMFNNSGNSDRGSSIA